LYMYIYIQTFLYDDHNNIVYMREASIGSNKLHK